MFGIGWASKTGGHGGGDGAVMSAIVGLLNAFPTNPGVELNGVVGSYVRVSDPIASGHVASLHGVSVKAIKPAAY